MNLLGSLASVSGLTLLSRALGVARDIAVAATFRTGTVTDAFFIAFKLPNLLRRFFAEGAFTQAFVPIFNEIRTREGDAGAKGLVAEMSGVLLLALLAVTAAGVIAAPLVIALVAPGFAETDGKQELAATLLRIMMPYILFMSLAALCSAVLNSFSRFKVPAFTPALLNLSMIFAALAVAPRLEEPILALAWGVFAGGVLQLGVQLHALRRIGMAARPAKPRKGSPVGRVLKLVGQGSLGVSVTQVNLALNMVFASFLVEGSVTWLYYADRLMELPAGLLGAAIAVVILPSLSRRRSESDDEGFLRVSDWAGRMTLLLATPAAAGLALLSVPVVTTLFEHGAFRPEDTMQTSAALRAYCIGIVGFIFVKVLASILFAHQDMITPVKISLAILAATQLMNAVFVLALGYGHVGLALSVGIAACMNALLLALSLRRRGMRVFLPGWGAFCAKVALGCAALAAAVAFANPEPLYWSESSPLGRVAMLGGLVALGAAAYFAALLAMGVRPGQFRLVEQAGDPSASKV